MVFVISVPSVISANPALNSLFECQWGFLYRLGPEALIFATGAVGNIWKRLSPLGRTQKQRCTYPENQEKTEVGVSGAEIQTLAVDARTAVWVSTAEKNFKIVLGETRNFSRMFGVVSAPALYKNPAVIVAV